MTHVLHLCGAFLQCDDPEGLSRWYAEALGLDWQEWGKGTCYGMMWPHALEGGTESHLLFTLQKAKAPLGASPRTCVVNLRVADLAGLTAGLGGKGIPVEGPTTDDYGSFAWITDPEGNRIELYEAVNEHGSA